MQWCSEWMFKMSSASCKAGCQSLAPFTDRVVNHFLVQMVPFLLDTLAALPRPWSGGACIHTLVESPTPRSRRGSDPDKTRSWTSNIVSGLRAVRGQPLHEQRPTLPVASILLSTVFNSTQRPVFIRKHSQYFCCSVQLLFSLTLLLCAYLLLKKAFCAMFNKNNYVTSDVIICKEYINKL